MSSKGYCPNCKKETKQKSEWLERHEGWELVTVCLECKDELFVLHPAEQ
jgi:hypothetical protein